MSKLVLQNVVKQYGGLKAVDGINLEVNQGELVTLLGPSGCGKTTTLRCISGFLVPEDGNIYIGNRDVTEIPPERRGIGLVFQNYALWPHMTVFKNIAFGLQLRKMEKSDIARRVKESLATVKLSGYEDRFPRELSGGQQQRIALARALVLEPDILLLDEPLSNLDALLREQMRFEIAQIHKRFGITTIYVTHDQTEAMVISDTIVLMNQGRIMQQGPPAEIYQRPTNRFVAGFMGTTNFIDGELTGTESEYVRVKTSHGVELVGQTPNQLKEKNVCVAIRPENVMFLDKGTPGAAENGVDNVFDARVLRATFLGETMDYELQVGPHRVRARGGMRLPYRVDDRVRISIDPNQLNVLPA